MFTLGSFYRSPEWKKLRSIVIAQRLQRDGELICDYCHNAIVNHYDCICHHTKYLTQQNVNDYSISLNEDNIQLLHHHCHNKIHERFGYNPAKKVYIVYGSPCAGKTTFVNNSADSADLIIDIDRIYTAINNERNNAVYNNVMEVYRCLIDMVKTRRGSWHNAWIVRGFPNCAERQRLADELDAELIFIDTDKMTCLERAAERAVDYDKIVLDWWKKYTP